VVKDRLVCLRGGYQISGNGSRVGGSLRASHFRSRCFAGFIFLLTTGSCGRAVLAQEKPRIVHVFVALADNAHTLRTPASLRA